MIAIGARKCVVCMRFYDCRENVLGEHARHAHVAMMMRTIAALIAAVLFSLAACELYVEPDPRADASASAVDAAPAVDAALPSCASLGCEDAFCNAAGVCSCHGEPCVQAPAPTP